MRFVPTSWISCVQSVELVVVGDHLSLLQPKSRCSLSASFIKRGRSIQRFHEVHVSKHNNTLTSDIKLIKSTKCLIRLERVLLKNQESWNSKRRVPCIVAQ